MTRISNIFVLAGLVNFAAVLVGSKGFTSDYLTELQPAVFSWLGLISIMLWGAAYIAVSRSYQKVPALLAVFFVEKVVYFWAWLRWVRDPPVPLSEVYESSLIAGVWFSGYGLIDLAFGLFFLWALIQVRKKKGS
jgi:hypothetical protein